MPNDELKTRVITNARRIIDERPESQRELARLAGVPYHVLWRCLDGRRHTMTTQSVVQLASILEIDPHELTIPV